MVFVYTRTAYIVHIHWMVCVCTQTSDEKSEREREQKKKIYKLIYSIIANANSISIEQLKLMFGHIKYVALLSPLCFDNLRKAPFSFCVMLLFFFFNNKNTAYNNNKTSTPATATKKIQFKNLQW